MSDNEDLHLGDPEKFSPSSPEANQLPENLDKLKEALEQRADGAGDTIEVLGDAYIKALDHVDTTSADPTLVDEQTASQQRMEEIRKHGKDQVEAAKQQLDNTLAELTEDEKPTELVRTPEEEAATVLIDRTVQPDVDPAVMSEAYNGYYTPAEDTAPVSDPFRTNEAPVQSPASEADPFLGNEAATAVLVEEEPSQPMVVEPTPPVVDAVRAPEPEPIVPASQVSEAQAADEANAAAAQLAQERQSILEQKARLRAEVDQSAVLQPTAEEKKHVAAARKLEQKRKASQEQSRVESNEEVEKNKAEQRYATLKTLRDELRAYGIKELEPALKDLDEQLATITPDDLTDENVKGKKLGIQLYLLTAAEVRLARDAKVDAMKELDKHVGEVFNPITKLDPGQNIKYNKPDSIGEFGHTVAGVAVDSIKGVSHMAAGIATAPILILKNIVWDKPWAIATAAAAVAIDKTKSALGIKRAAEQQKGLERIKELNQTLLELNDTSSSSQVSRRVNAVESVAKAKAEYVLAGADDAGREQRFIKAQIEASQNELFQRLLEQLTSRARAMPAEQGNPIMQAIGEAQATGTLESLFSFEADGSVKVNIPNVEPITKTDVTRERKFAHYAILNHDTLQDACAKAARIMFAHNREALQAIQAGMFHTSIDQSGTWIVHVNGELIPIDKDFTQGVFSGIDAGKIDAATKQLQPDYLNSIMKGEVQLPPLPAELTQEAASAEALNQALDLPLAEISKLDKALGEAVTMAERAKICQDLAKQYTEAAKALNSEIKLLPAAQELATAYQVMAKAYSAEASAQADPFIDTAVLITNSNDTIARTRRDVKLLDKSRAFQLDYGTKIDGQLTQKLQSLLADPRTEKGVKLAYKKDDALQLPSEFMKLGKGDTWKITSAVQGCYTLEKEAPTELAKLKLVLTQEQLQQLVDYQKTGGKTEPVKVRPASRRERVQTVTPADTSDDF